MNILLVTGGNSLERKISLLSAAQVRKALLENGHKVKIYDLKNGYLPIKDLAKKYDVLFPVLHGEEGEGGKLHKYLSKQTSLLSEVRTIKGLKTLGIKYLLKNIATKTACSPLNGNLLKKLKM